MFSSLSTYAKHLYRMQPIIEVKNLVKRYKNAHENAVDDILFSVSSGEFFAFLGPNGAGKTTTVSILTTTLQLSCFAIFFLQIHHNTCQKLGLV